MSMKFKRVCVECEREMKPSTTGAVAVELQEEDGEPYRVWACDIVQCPKCEMEMIASFADEPLRESYNEDFDEYVAKLYKQNKKRVVTFW